MWSYPFLNIQEGSRRLSIPQAFLPCLKRNDSQTFKISKCKKLVLQLCMLLLQLTSINVFYKSLSLLFNHHVYTLFETSDLKEVRILLIISLI